MTIGVLIQAHLGSTRLPKKVLLPLGDMSIIEHCIFTACRSIADIVIVCTTTDSSNNELIEHINRFKDKYKKLHIYVYDGKENDVLSRYYECANKYKIDNICRMTSDCPLHISELIDLCIKVHILHENDYTSFLNVDGLDTEVISFKALEESNTNAKTTEEREHVTKYIKERSSLKKERLEDIKLSVDEDIDFKRTCEVYNTCKQKI